GVDVKASECGLVGGAVGVHDWALGPGPATRADRNIEPEIYQSSLIRICGHDGHPAWQQVRRHPSPPTSRSRAATNACISAWSNRCVARASDPSRSANARTAAGSSVAGWTWKWISPPRERMATRVSGVSSV